ncbi:hypothetical protein C8R45DRAFT_1183627 [Mycena sanguinolenta]|nr:hypothetical protein C8R45DRAFT_1183627 [Mycena sanguinolenta]
MDTTVAMQIMANYASATVFLMASYLKFASRFVTDVAPFLGFLVDGPTGNEHLEVFYHRQTTSPEGVLLNDVVSAYGPHLRSIVVPETPTYPDVLGLCMRLERFECESLPSRALVASISRIITTLVVMDHNRGDTGIYDLQPLAIQFSREQ